MRAVVLLFIIITGQFSFSDEPKHGDFVPRAAAKRPAEPVPSGELDSVIRQLKKLCPDGTPFSSGLQLEGTLHTRELQTLNGVDYHAGKALLLFMLSKVESELKDKPETDENKNLNSLLQMARSKLLEDKISLGRNVSPGLTAAIAHDPKQNPLRPTFVFGRDFEKEFFRTPHYYLGVLMHEMQHYHDLTDKERGPWHDSVRFSRQHESCGHWTEATFFKLLPEKIRLNDSRIAEQLAAAKEGPESASWAAHLDHHQGEDYSLRDKIQTYQFKTIFQKKEAGVVFDEFLLPLAKEMAIEATKLWEEVERVKNLSKNSPEMERYHKRFSRLQTFLKSAPSFFQDFKLMFGATQPTASDIAKQEEWATLLGMVTLVNGKLAKDVGFVNSLHEHEHQEVLDAVDHTTFLDWLEKHEDGAKVKGSFKKQFCDEEGKARKNIWDSVPQNQTTAPRLSGVDMKELENQLPKGPALLPQPDHGDEIVRREGAVRPFMRGEGNGGNAAQGRIIRIPNPRHGDQVIQLTPEIAIGQSDLLAIIEGALRGEPGSTNFIVALRGLMNLKERERLENYIEGFLKGHVAPNQLGARHKADQLKREQQAVEARDRRAREKTQQIEKWETEIGFSLGENRGKKMEMATALASIRGIGRGYPQYNDAIDRVVSHFPLEVLQTIIQKQQLGLEPVDYYALQWQAILKKGSRLPVPSPVPRALEYLNRVSTEGRLEDQAVFKPAIRHLSGLLGIDLSDKETLNTMGAWDGLGSSKLGDLNFEVHSNMLAEAAKQTPKAIVQKYRDAFKLFNPTVSEALDAALQSGEVGR